MEKRANLPSALMIITATLIWGAGYAAQTAGMGYVSPLTFNAARFLIGGTMALGPAMFFLNRQRRNASAQNAAAGTPADINKSTVRAGIICGAVLCVAINLQQFGLVFTTVANASFITTLYVIMVPIACMFLFKQKVMANVWVAVVLAMAGVYLLSLSGVMYVNIGDVLVFLCAIAFAAQILIISHFSPKHNVFALACVQFYTVSVVSLVLALVFENPSMTGVVAAAPYVLYTGVLSSGVAYILQMKAQKTTHPTIAAILFSFEGVVAAFTAWLVLRQFLSAREIAGCVLIFAAILVAQVEFKRSGAEPHSEGVT